MPEDLEKQYQAKGLLRAEMARRNSSYEDLAEKLKGIGVEENPKNFSNKVGRGSFTAGFFLQCLEAIGCKSVRIVDGSDD
ncbi:DUF6471 domain-containing protein [Hyphococcus sp.]|uniref:DUF6471 domain-containing protein n=1 Tax=Hyphococcus sp. TaxID=2038636 RepID=UPI0035C774B3